jgi:AcrR family transcriptional regulator
MTTRHNILKTSLQLFNDATVGSISTNHIAKAARISPGNLYYHYRNKEAIIRDIFELMQSEFEAIWLTATDRVTLADLRQSLCRSFEILWRYRFFYREQLALFRNDPLLQQRHQEIQALRLDQQSAFLKQFIRDGVIRMPADPAKLKQILTATWILTTQWLAYLEMSGEQISDKHHQQGIDLIFAVIAPYLND